MGVNEEIIAEIDKLEISEKEKGLMKVILNFEEEKNNKTFSSTKFRDQYNSYFTKFVEDKNKDEGSN